jgi:GST-like protein
MAGQAHHFRLYAPESIAYAIDRYTRETHKYYAVLESQLSTSPFLTDELSIADVAVLPWVYRHARHGVDLDQFPAVAAWYERLMGRDDVKSGFAAGESLIATGDLTDAGAKQHLF